VIPPRYLHRLDRDAFLREWSFYAEDTIGAQAGRDFARLAEDLERHDAARDADMADLHRQVADLEDALFKVKA
jgi:hypothetical protein